MRLEEIFNFSLCHTSIIQFKTGKCKAKESFFYQYRNCSPESDLIFRAAKLRKREEKACGEDEKVGSEGESLNKCSEFGAILFIRAGGCDVF